MRRYILVLLRIFLRILAVVLSICIFPSKYYFSLDIRRRRHIKKEVFVPPGIKYLLSYMTIREKRGNFQRLWSDIDTLNNRIIDSVKLLFSKDRCARVFPTVSGAHVVSTKKYPLWRRKQLLYEAIKLGCSKNHMIHQIGEEKYYSAGCRVTSKYVSNDGYIIVDISPSTIWRLSDPFPIHLMNIIIRINRIVCYCINTLFGGKL